MKNETLQAIDLWVVHGMLIGQLVFVIVWASLPWWKEWIGRALMLKSFALLLLLLIAVVNYWVIQLWGGYPGMELVTLGTHILVFLGIWSQVVAIAHEIRAANQGDRRVTGTEETRV